VAVTDQNWAHWLERLYNLRRDKRGTHERPHKPVLLLAILDLLDRGVIRINAVPFNEELVATFRRWFAIVRSEDDQPTLENPFYFLGGDKFWQVVPAGQNEPLYREGFAGGAPSAGQLRKQAAIGRFATGSPPRGKPATSEGGRAPGGTSPGPRRGVPPDHPGTLRFPLRGLRRPGVAEPAIVPGRGRPFDPVRRQPERPADQWGRALPEPPLGHGPAPDRPVS
jgi:hypothetical protein